MPLEPSPRWHEEVPGTRWFRADLHLHTLDDHDGGRIAVPGELAGGSPQDPDLLTRYAHLVLDAAVQRGVQVLGLTPHDVRTGPTTSAAWAIVEAWQRDANADGRAYRDLVYAVYPGFEPALNVGRRGLHLLFLMDPCIGRERYLRLFDALMGGVSPWHGNQLRISSLDERRFFEVLDDFHARENGLPLSDKAHWDYLVLAPHAFAENGLFGALQAQALQLFPSLRLAGIELGDNQMPEDAFVNRHWLGPGMQKARQAFYHASDAYGIEPDPSADALFRVGSRVTLLKLGAPTVTALRQSFLAADARIRLAYRKVGPHRLADASDIPDACPVTRPWLRSVTVRGGTSFHRDQKFHFSPDLTCIIGGSMTGKSTLLDGLRLECCGLDGMPDANTSVGKAVWARARDHFRSGNSTVTLESPALDASLLVKERFGFKFFAQGELKTLSEDDDGIEHLLFHLVPGRGEGLLSQRQQLQEHDAKLVAGAQKLAKLDEQIGDAEQKFKRTHDARQAMQRFARAGADALAPAQQDAARTTDFQRDVERTLHQAGELLAVLDTSSVPQVSGQGVIDALSGEPDAPSTAELFNTARRSLQDTVATLQALRLQAGLAAAAAKRALDALTASVQSALVEAGGSATDLNEFETFAKAAQHYESFRAALDQKKDEIGKATRAFEARLEDRDKLVAQHREQVLAVCRDVEARFEGRVLVELQKEGRKLPLEQWLIGLHTKGITQWWNSGGRENATAGTIRDIAVAIEAQDTTKATDLCTDAGMSVAVARSFLEQLGPWSRQLEAQALRTPDRYQIKWVEEGVPKDLDDLSGGRKVAVLLSLLLESDDTTPLFIDQPEDELDNRFLNETIIPALHRLKGKRQVVFATHNANLVVNGDADQVIALEADAQHGRVDAEGAIEDPAVREAIVRTLDGGQEAFALRRRKYGF